MQAYTFSFIGVGNMGGALARAAVKKLPPEQVFLSNRTFEKAEALAAELGCAAGPADRAARDGKFIFLGVKPQMMADLLAEIGPVLAERTDRFLLVTMAAGLTMARIAAMAGGEYPVIRIMPNTPCAVGEGIVLCDANGKVTVEELDEFTDALSGAGIIDRLDERLIDAGCALSGCGPAFVCLLLEALADSGVGGGRPRQKAQLYAPPLGKCTAALHRGPRAHPGEKGPALRRPDGKRHGGAPAGHRGPPWGAEGRGMLPWGDRHRRSPGPGGAELPGRGHGGGDRIRGKDEGIGEVTLC